ncbi:DUF4446 family protein [Marinisporobacter balticus]|uniref:Uncharacterized protein DUF4446 n=1 Tax=Marinisporobacter balticus TaxID=2018667 RepID=A0A4R2KW07_9FIRM|nr:DUF4446 family protein [Marinisporobacter balticus]TCO78033.1 uncharacterized protein DUF4446 [Marinisporobacter balticus]
MDYIFSFIKQNFEIIVLYSVIISILSLVILCIQGAKLSKLKKKYERLSNNIEGKNIEEIIHEYYQKIDHLDIRMNKMDALIENVERKLLYSIQKVGFVQYNAFDDVGGSLSFTIALLNEQNTGFILTNIYSRNNSIVYGKTIKDGKSTHTLSAEELQALDRAKNKSLDEYVKIA